MPRKPAAKKAEPKAKKTKVVEKIEEVKAPAIPDGIVEGIYSTSVYKDGDKISFDIDWDKLKEHMRTV